MLFGHSHIQFRRTIDGQEFINPGSVGQPRLMPAGTPAHPVGLLGAAAARFDRRELAFETPEFPLDAGTNVRFGEGEQGPRGSRRDS